MRESIKRKGAELSRSTLRYSHRPLALALCPESLGLGAGRRPGQPGGTAATGLSWGQDSPETVVVVGVVRIVVVAVGTARVVGVVVPVAAAQHAVGARWPPPQIVRSRCAGSPGCGTAA